MAGLLESPEISGLLYKRRGGFGKMMPNAWQYRFFAVTKDGVLLYFDTEIPDVEHLETKARGKLDLKAVNFEISTEAIEGAPTPHAISIAATNEEKWKMCSETKEDQSRWLKVFTKYTLPENKSLARGPVSYTSDDDDRPSRGLSRANTTMTGAPASLSSSSKGDDVKQPAVTPSKAAAVSALDAASTKAAPSTTQHPHQSHHRKPRLKASLHAHAAPNYDDRDKYELVLVLAIVNVCFVGVLRAASWASLFFFLLIGNFVVAYTLLLRSVRVKKAEAQQQAANEAAEKANAAAAAAAASATPATSPDKGAAVTTTTTTASGKTVAVESEASSDKALGKSKPLAGSTLVQSDEDHRTAPPHTWTKIDGKLFQVRIGPEYNRYKKKAPSGPPLYEAVAVDIFWYAPRRRVARRTT